MEDTQQGEARQETAAQERAPQPTYPERPAEMGILREFWAFLRVRKKYWLAPIIIALLLLGLLIIVGTQASVVSPFVYML